MMYSGRNRNTFMEAIEVEAEAGVVQNTDKHIRTHVKYSILMHFLIRPPSLVCAHTDRRHSRHGTAFLYRGAPPS
jgi:hypothetical protein